MKDLFPLLGARTGAAVLIIALVVALALIVRIIERVAS